MYIHHQWNRSLIMELQVYNTWTRSTGFVVSGHTSDHTLSTKKMLAEVCWIKKKAVALDVTYLWCTDSWKKLYAVFGLLGLRCLLRRRFLGAAPLAIGVCALEDDGAPACFSEALLSSELVLSASRFVLGLLTNLTLKSHIWMYTTYPTTLPYPTAKELLYDRSTKL